MDNLNKDEINGLEELEKMDNVNEEWNEILEQININSKAQFKRDNNNLNNSISFDINNNQNIFNISNNTYATCDANSQLEIEKISFISLKNNEPNNINKNKDMTKESIEILKNFISIEKYMISNNDNKSILDENNYINNIKKIKSNLFFLDNKITDFFKKPYMRKNLQKLNNINRDTSNIGKIKYNKENIKLEEISKQKTKINNNF